jgi:hypothetical protein
VTKHARKSQVDIDENKSTDWADQGTMSSPAKRRVHIVATLLVAGLIGVAIGTSPVSAQVFATSGAGGSPVTPRSEACSSSASLSSASLQTYIETAQAAQTSGRTVCVPADSRFTVDATATVTAPALLNFNGATITKAPFMVGPVLSVAAAGVDVVNLDLAGNERGGAQGGGVLWLGLDGLMYNDHVSNTAANGVQVTGPDASLTIDASSSDDNVNSDLTGDGFFAARGALLTTVDTSATWNDRSGYFLVHVADGSSVSGSSADNRFAGLEVQAANGLKIPEFVSTSDWHYGLYIGGDSNACSIGQLQITNTGIAQGDLPGNSYGAGIEFFGATNCQVTSITDTITWPTSGYGVALAHQSSRGGYVGRGSDGNLFRNVRVSGTGNPGIDITGASSHNVFLAANASGCAVGVNIGEGTVGNDGNVFAHLVLDNDWFSGIGLENSNANVFQMVQLIDVGSRYPSASGNAGVRLIGTADGNAFEHVAVGVAPHAANDRSSYKLPQYVVFAQSGTVANRVGIASLTAGTYAEAPWADYGRNDIVKGTVPAP